MHVHRYCLLYFFILIHCVQATRKSRHIHSQQLVKNKKLGTPKSQDYFVLRCPKIPKTTNEKTYTNVAWIHNNQTVFSVIGGKIAHLMGKNTTVKRWHTLDGQLNILANTSRWKFEYEEKRRWYAFKIKHPEIEDDGIWKCRMVVWFGKSGIARRYESRKRIYMKNRPEFFTFKKRNLSDLNERQFNDFDNPITFTKPNADYTVFSRMSKFNDIAYVRNSDIIDRSEDQMPTQVGFILQNEDDASSSMLTRNYSSVHALPAFNFTNPCKLSTYLFVLTLLICVL